ncbi:hypothetical protein SALBM311S_09048 [Streptomyces alboniger]
MSNAPYDLRIDSGGDQFTVSGPAPRLSWKPPSDAGHAVGHELECTVDGDPQPAVTTAPGTHRFLPWPWTALRSGRRVAWRVRALDTEGRGPWSEWNVFEVGLLDEDWQARWISPPESGDPGHGRRPAHTLTTRFEARPGVRSARLYATALGVYEAYVNGERAGTAELSPGSTSYDRTLYAQASDVTAAVEDDLMDGQTTDFRSEPGAARPVLVDQVEAPAMAPAIDWSPAPPVRVVDSRPPLSVEQLEDGVWVADFGQNASGWIALDDLGPAGTRTVVDYGEHVGVDGDLTTAHLDSVRPGEDPGRLRPARRGRLRGPGRDVRAAPHRARLPVRAHPPRRRPARPREHHDARRAHRPAPHRRLRVR